MGRIIFVPTGEREYTNLSKDDVLYTGDLEACVAIAGIDKKKQDSRIYGALAHITQITPLSDVISWFYEHIHIDEKVYIVGGMKCKSEQFVSTIQAKLKEKGYTQFREVVLTEHYLDFSLGPDRAKVEYHILRRDPMGLTKQCVGTKLI